MFIRVAAASLAIAAASPSAAAEVNYDVATETYICERGATIPVTYINVDGKPALAVATIEGRQIPMFHRNLTGGPVYVAANEQESYRWTTDGDTARLTFLEADDSAKEQTLLALCQRQEQPSVE